MCIKALRVLTQRTTLRGATQGNPRTMQSNVTAAVVCYLQIKQVRTTDLSIWEWVEGNLCIVCFVII